MTGYLMTKKRICVFGNCKKSYSRNKVFFKALSELDYEIVERFSERFSFINFLKIFLSTLFFTKFDAIFLLYPGTVYILPAKIICVLRRKPLIFDFLIYVYETEVEYEHWKPTELKARIGKLTEKLAVNLANRVILDNPQKTIFFKEEFGIDGKKISIVPIGTDESIFFPRKKPVNKTFEVLWYGNVMPNQGFEYICDAAERLEKNKEISFTFIGANWRYLKAKEKYGQLKNIIFLGSIPINRLPDYISRADICLGQFGLTIKTKKGLANKMFECTAMKKPYINGETPAMNRYFKHKRNVYFAKCGNAEEIVNAIIELKRNRGLREKIAEGGYELFKKEFSELVIKKKLKEVLNTYCI